MSIDSHYVSSSDLESYFVDKETGLPLVGGYINFYSDVNRSTPKDVFTISGSPPDYTFVNLGSTVDLSATGTPVDESGNNITIYYYPYNADGNIELYYVEVFSAEDVLQFPREAWPPGVAQSAQQGVELLNYVPNGQFLLHNNIHNNDIPEGQLTSGITNIAPGGWYASIPTTTSVNTITFPPYGEFVLDPTSSPRYSLQFTVTSPDSSDDYKLINLVFDDVNKFSSDIQLYTVSFSAITNASADFIITLDLIKFFGTGGSPSPTETTQLTEFTITDTQTQFEFSFVFGANEATQVGTNGDDTVTLSFSFPTDVVLGINMTDFILTPGSIEISSFPTTTDDEFLSVTLVPPVPDYDGNTLYLPIISTLNGYGYDYSEIGKVYATVNGPQGNELLCDGSGYITQNYSSLGIPYSRLQQKLISGYGPVFTYPIFGTGPNFANAVFEINGTGVVVISTNTNQGGTPQIASSDGLVPTGFVIQTCSFAFNSLELSAQIWDVTNTWVINSAVGPAAGTNSPGTSGIYMNIDLYETNGTRPGSYPGFQIMAIEPLALSSGGSYFNFSNPVAQFYMWFIKDGVGTDPGQPGIGFSLSYSSNISLITFNYMIAQVLNSRQVTQITCVAGSSITPGAYFLFHVLGQAYAVWYSTGSTTKPTLPGTILIEVVYSTSDTVDVISALTASAINDYSFAVPDLRGQIIKGAGGNDSNGVYRYSPWPYLAGGNVGTYQFDMLLSHNHPAVSSVEVFASGAFPGSEINYVTLTGAASPYPVSTFVGNAGTSQNDVKNVDLNFVIKY